MSELTEDVDADEIDDETYDDDEDDDDSPAITPHDSPAEPPLHFVLEEGARHVETYISRDGPEVRMDSVETYACGEQAAEIAERLREALVARGYKRG